MKKILLFIIYLPSFVILSYLIFQTVLKYNSSSINSYVSKNVLKNSDFKEGFKNWKHDEGIIITNVNNVTSVLEVGADKNLKRFHQDVYVVSGKVYRLRFNLTSKKSGALAICRYNLTGKEEYLVCDGKNDNKTYVWNIRPKRTGKNSLFFACNKEGQFYFSKIQLLDNEIVDKLKVYKLVFFIIVLALILQTIVFLLKFNITFAFFIAALMIIPILNIDMSKASKAENRNLATYKPIISNGEINTLYGKELNDFFNDRFFGRKIAILCHRDMRYITDKRVENSKASQGRDGWLFEKFDPDHFLPSYDTDKLLIKSILRCQSIYNELGIKTYFASIPEKSSVYTEYNYYKGTEEKLSEILSTNDSYNFIFLLDDFLKEKNNGYLYFKDDHHWTERGAFIYSKELLKECKKVFPQLVELNDEDFEVTKIKNTYYTSVTQPTFYEEKGYIGSIRHLLNIDNSKYNFTDYYNAYRHKKYPIPKTVLSNSKPFFSKYINNDVNNQLKIFIIGDSNISFLIPFLTASFHECTFIQVNLRGNNGWHIKNYKGVIESTKPDIMLLISRSENIKSWLGL